MKSRYLLPLLIVCFTLLGPASLVAALPDTTDDAATKRFAYPMPGRKGLSGTFGELRHTHFHAGMDIRTNEEIGKPVHAIADAYLFRVKVSHVGYGKTLYLCHRDGSRSVYGHLSRFAPKIQRLIRNKQKRRRRFQQEMFFSDNQITFEKGDVIGYSGNTGSSGGPHLHFEVRDPQSRIVNPMKFYRDVIEDDRAPYLSRVAFQPLQGQARVNGRFDKDVFYPEKTAANRYKLEEVVKVQGPIGFEFTSYDRIPQSTRHLGIYGAKLYLDGQRIYSFDIDTFSFSQDKYLYQHLDFEYLKWHSSWLQRAYLEPGNGMPIYGPSKNRGRIHLKDDQVHQLRLEVRDYHGNVSTFRCKLQRSAHQETLDFASRAHQNAKRYWVKRGHVVLQGPQPRNQEEAQFLVTFQDGSQGTVPMDYTYERKGYGILKLQPGKLPVSAQHPRWDEPLAMDFKKAMVPSRGNSYKDGEGVQVYVPGRALFDTLFLEVSKTRSEDPNICSPIVSISDQYTPLFKRFYFDLPKNERAQNYPADKIVAVKYYGKGRYSHRSQARSGSYKSSSFGKFCLVADMEPPRITMRSERRITPETKSLEFHVQDPVSGIHPYKLEAYLDGEWTVIEYYAYQERLLLRFDEAPVAGSHELRIRLEDRVGNETVKTYNFSVAS